MELINMLKRYLIVSQEDKQKLEHLYMDEKITRIEIAKRFGCHVDTLRKRARELNLVEKRKQKRIDKASRCYSMKELEQFKSKKCIDFLNGEMLGDGSIYNGGIYSNKAYFRYGTSKKEYIEWLSKTLASFGLEQCGKINSYTKTGKEVGLSKICKQGNKYDKKLYTSHFYCSKGYEGLKMFYNR